MLAMIAVISASITDFGFNDSSFFAAVAFFTPSAVNLQELNEASLLIGSINIIINGSSPLGYRLFQNQVAAFK